jgi:hypothetical protein
MNISPSDYRGKTLSGIAVTENCFMGAIPFDALLNYVGLHRPSRLEKATKRDLQDTKLRIAHEVRSQVQRRFDNDRLKRARAYSLYLEQLYAGVRTGGFPPITLYTPELGETDNEGKLVLRFNAALVNLDGETQTEARFMLVERDMASGQYPVPFVLYHGISQEHASAIMHDVNFYAKPVAERKIAILNSNGYLSRIVVEELGQANIDGEKISRLANIPTKKQLVAFSGLISGAAGALVGYSITNNLPGAITQLNNYLNGAQAEKARPFLRQALANVASIGHHKPVIWALAGGHYHATNQFLPVPHWDTLAAAYKEARFERGTPNQGELKRKAAFAAIGINI